jgi:hypothetical protein
VAVPAWTIWPCAAYSAIATKAPISQLSTREQEKSSVSFILGWSSGRITFASAVQPSNLSRCRAKSQLVCSDSIKPSEWLNVHYCRPQAITRVNDWCGTRFGIYGIVKQSIKKSYEEGRLPWHPTS